MFQAGSKYLFLVLLAIGILWIKSSTGKISSGNFPATLGETLSKVAIRNPFSFFKGFLEGFAIPNAQIFGNLVMWGELLTGLAIIISIVWLLVSRKINQLVILLLGAGLIGGIFLNTVFWFGFGYTSPAVDSLNLLMIVVQVIGLVFVFKHAKVR